MATRSARLSGPISLLGAKDTVLENPSGSDQTYLLKWITAVNVTGTARTLTLYRSVGSGATVACWKTSLAGAASVTFAVFWCLQPEERLDAAGGVDDAIVLTVDGAILVGTAY